MIPPSPVSGVLQAVIARAYAQAPDRLPPQLCLCHCPVCVDQPTRQLMLATPIRSLTPELIREYSGSAHGVPDDPADLTAILPRYLDLMAQGIAVDHVGVGVELRRFGEARAAKPPALTAASADLLDGWGRLMILHCGWRAARGAPDGQEALVDLVETLIVGGLPLPLIITALEDLFADPDCGRAAILGFLAEIGERFWRHSLGYWAVMQYRPEAAAALADWLNLFLADPGVLEIGTDPDLPADLALKSETALNLAGTLTPARIG